MSNVLLTYGQSKFMNIIWRTLAKPSNLYLALLVDIDGNGVGSAVDPAATTDQITADYSSGAGKLTEDKVATDSGYVRTAIPLGDSYFTETAGATGVVEKMANTAAITVTALSSGLTGIVGWALCWGSTIGGTDAIMAGAFPVLQQGSYASGDTITIPIGNLYDTLADANKAN